MKNMHRPDNIIYLILIGSLSAMVGREISKHGVDLLIIFALLLLAIGWIVFAVVFLEIKRNKAQKLDKPNDK